MPWRAQQSILSFLLSPFQPYNNDHTIVERWKRNGVTLNAKPSSEQETDKKTTRITLPECRVSIWGLSVQFHALHRVPQKGFYRLCGKSALRDSVLCTACFSQSGLLAWVSQIFIDRNLLCGTQGDWRLNRRSYSAPSLISTPGLQSRAGFISS